MRTLQRLYAAVTAAVLAFSPASYGLVAPFLISVTAQSGTSVSLAWRNNDIATTGYIIQRRDSTEAVYHFIDSVGLMCSSTTFPVVWSTRCWG
jgi:hypothetical protein